MKQQTKVPGELRIIGGKWRGKKLRFPALPGVRPTPDRVRETLFNWLMADIQQAHCLDLFAGSGALGLEALSRGAASVVFVDQQPEITRHLQTTLKTLAVDNSHVLLADASQSLALPDKKFDIIFLDPPFHSDCLAQCCAWLQQGPWLIDQGLIYIETALSEEQLPLPRHWRVCKAKRAGQVYYYLVETGGAYTARE